MSSLSEAAPKALEEVLGRAGSGLYLYIVGLALLLATVWVYFVLDLVPKHGDIRPRKRRLLRRNSMRRQLEKPPVVVGHRGMGSTVAAGVEENTVESFRLAAQGACDGLETDVQMTRDGVFVLYHDDVFRGRNVSDYTFEEIRAQPLGRRGRFRVPSLFELLEVVRAAGHRHDTFRLVLELKGAEFKGRDNVQMLYSYLALGGYLPLVSVVSSFNHEALAHATAVMGAMPDGLADHIHIGALFNRSNSALEHDYLDRARRCGADEIHLRANHASKAIVDLITTEELEVMIYFPASRETADQIDDVLRLGPGVTVVCTNTPALLRRRLGQLAGNISETEGELTS